jgi:hypothetical protein
MTMAGTRPVARLPQASCPRPLADDWPRSQALGMLIAWPSQLQAPDELGSLKLPLLGP